MLGPDMVVEIGGSLSPKLGLMCCNWREHTEKEMLKFVVNFWNFTLNSSTFHTMVGG
jgi:hypothetical protein